MVQQYYEDRIRTMTQFPMALVALGLILIYFADILRSLAIAILLFLIFSPVIEALSEPFYYPMQLALKCAGLRMLRRGEKRRPDAASWPQALGCADMIARIKVPRLLCVLVVLAFVGCCFWLLIAKTFASVSGLLQDSDKLLDKVSSKVDQLRLMLKDSYLAGTVDWDAVFEMLVSHAREMTTQDSIEMGIWWVIRLVRVALGYFFIIFLMFMFLTLAGEARYPSTRRNRPKSDQVRVVEKYLYAQTFLSLLTAAINGSIYSYLHVPAAFVFALTTFWLNFIPVIGSVIAVLLPLPLALVALDLHDCMMAFVLPTIMQAAIGNTLYPVLMGRTMLLHPVTILVGMSMFGTIWSIPGMILSVPVLGVLKSVLQVTDHPYAQVCSFVLQGNVSKAAESWETARKRLTAPTHDRGGHHGHHHIGHGWSTIRSSWPGPLLGSMSSPRQRGASNSHTHTHHQPESPREDGEAESSPRSHGDAKSGGPARAVRVLPSAIPSSATAPGRRGYVQLADDSRDLSLT